MKKKILAVFAVVAIVTGCSVFKDIHIPPKITIGYNCGNKIKISEDFAVVKGCNGVDTIFITQDTVILVPNTP